MCLAAVVATLGVLQLVGVIDDLVLVVGSLVLLNGFLGFSAGIGWLSHYPSRW